ncbi:MAG: ammonia-forming cytochrome c nitrite reductase subunit c552 [Bacillota bacterium]
MKKLIGIIAAVLVVALIGGGLLWNYRTGQAEVAFLDTYQIPAGELKMEVWGNKYPLHYDSYLKTAEGGVGGSKYRGSENYSRLSAWPFQYVLFDGWGMGVEYTEARGHVYALTDQLDIDPSRKAAGGVCLTCKTPLANQMREQMGVDYFRLPYDEVHAKLPEEAKELGPACIDCHNTEDAGLRLNRWTLEEGLTRIGKDPNKLTTQELRTLTCAQCHVTYAIPKDENKKSIDLLFPWEGGSFGNITIEDIEKTIKDNGLYEWTNKLIDMPLGHVRHPEFELFSNQSTHWSAGLACADCHLPYQRVGSVKISSHNLASPLKTGLEPCLQCHKQTEEELKERIFFIQDRTNHLLTKAGNGAAQAVKAIEMAMKTAGTDQDLIAEAKEFFEKAYYRVVFVSAENSMGFHNPPEAMRVLADGLDYAYQAELKAREALLKAGVTPPDEFDLELENYDIDEAVLKEAVLINGR